MNDAGIDRAPINGKASIVRPMNAVARLH